MKNFEWVLENISVVLSIVIMILLLGCGIFLTIKLRFFQVRKFNYALNNTINPTIKSIFKKNKDKTNEVSAFSAFSTAVSGTVGTGNIVGVATAISLGGAGSVFWMWVSAFFGMVTNYAENVLGMYFRKKHNDEYKGGPMYYIEKGLNLKWLAVIFAVFAAIASIGFNFAQANSISTSINDLTNIPLWVIGIVISVISGLVLIGGIKRISRFSSFVVPFMVIIFLGLSTTIIVINYKNIPSSFNEIFKSAFNFKSVSGGILGYGITRAMRYGISRGIFSNEAGLGSSVMAHAQSSEKEPVIQGLWGVFSIFLDTFVICSLTALVLLTTNAFDTNLEGASIALYAFSKTYGMFGKIIFTIILTLFAFTTLISWGFYGIKAIEYIFGNIGVKIFKVIYVLLSIVGSVIAVNVVWTISDIFNVLMAIPNLIALIALSGLVKNITKNYFDRKKGIEVAKIISYDVFTTLEVNKIDE